jgi:hypothetical protein
MFVYLAAEVRLFHHQASFPLPLAQPSLSHYQ